MDDGLWEIGFDAEVTSTNGYEPNLQISADGDEWFSVSIVSQPGSQAVRFGHSELAATAWKIIATPIRIVATDGHIVAPQSGVIES